LKVRIEENMQQANTAYDMSNIPLVLKMAPGEPTQLTAAQERNHATESKYKKWKKRLKRLLVPPEGTVATVWYAGDDIMCRRNGDSCTLFGSAFINPTDSTIDNAADRLFIVNVAERGIARSSFPHELGHLMGLTHNIETRGRTDSCPFCGNIIQCKSATKMGFMTIMSYACSSQRPELDSTGSEQRTLFFSAQGESKTLSDGKSYPISKTMGGKTTNARARVIASIANLPLDCTETSTCTGGKVCHIRNGVGICKTAVSDALEVKVSADYRERASNWSMKHKYAAIAAVMFFSTGFALIFNRAKNKDIYKPLVDQEV
jgi:hypothetical protein